MPNLEGDILICLGGRLVLITLILSLSNLVQFGNNAILSSIVILVTSFATYISRFLGAFTSEKISEKSKIYRWFNCIAYSTLAALISRILIFPSGDLSEVNYISRIIVILLSILIFYVTKRNLVYPTVLSAIILAALNSFVV